MISIISGTNRRAAMTYQVAKIYENELQKHKQNCQILDLDELPQDFIFSALYEKAGQNTLFNTFIEKIDASEKYIFVVPEYNGSFPGVLKAFIDGLPYPSSFENKKVALVSLSAGQQGGALALSHLTDILHYLGANVLGMKVRLPHFERHFQDGKITNSFYNELIVSQLEKFLHF